MLNPSMLDPAILAFFKQAGEAFKQMMEAEAAGRLNKALRRYCGDTIPLTPQEPGFLDRCQLYAAKAYAMAHIDGEVTWGGMRELLNETGAWPPAPDLGANGALFHGFTLGFLIGSDLPRKRHDAIVSMLPMLARFTDSPDSLASKLGMTPEQLQAMASNPKVQEMMARFKRGDS